MQNQAQIPTPATVAANPETPQLFISRGAIKTTSLDVAEKFGRKHKHVLRDIKNLGCSAEFNGSNFGLVEYTDEKGEKRPMYEMTRDGWAVLVMGFSGPKAMVWKEKYIAAFNLMERRMLDSLEREKPAWVAKGIDISDAMSRSGIAADQVKRYIHFRRCGATQREVAAMFGVSRDRVKRIEKKLRAVGIRFKPASAKARGAAMDDVIGRAMTEGDNRHMQLPMFGGAR